MAFLGDLVAGFAGGVIGALGTFVPGHPFTQHAARGGSPGGPAATVVFVCEHGSAKSLLAASLFDRMAKERGSSARAVSRGTQPDESVPPAVARALADEGFDVAWFRPRALSEADLRGAARTVAIGVDLGDVAARTRTRISRWDDVPPVSTNYPAARAALVSRIRSLLRELERDASPKP